MANLAGSNHFERERAIAASRPTGFNREMADRIHSMEEALSDYKAFLEKGKTLDIEFLEGDWPDYWNDVKIIERIQQEIRLLEPTITGLELVEIFKLVRADLAADKTK